MDEIPNDDTQHMWAPLIRSTTMYQGKEIYGTYWPKNDPRGFFQDYLKKYSAFYELDANTPEGLERIAEHYGVKGQWKGYRQEVPLWKMTEELIQLIQEHGNDNKNYHLVPWEGCQRCMAIVHYSLQSPIDFINGAFKPGMLTGKHIADNFGNQLQDSIRNAPPNVLQLSEEHRRDGTQTRMHNRPIRVDVDYVINPDTDAKRLFQYYQLRSGNIAKEKHTSAAKEIMEEINTRVMQDYLGKDVNDDRLVYRPNFANNEEFKQGSMSHKTQPQVLDAMGAETTLSDETERSEFMQWALIVNNPTYVQYTKNPLDKQAYDNVKELFMVPAIDGKYQITGKDVEPFKKGTTIGPPFIPTMETQAVDATMEVDGSSTKWSHRVNAETANNHLIGPRILLILYAGYNNMNIEKVKDDDKFKGLLKYYVRYCTHGQMTPNTTDLHGVYKHIYGCGDENETFSGNACPIGATLFLTEMINSCIMHYLHDEANDLQKRRTKWNDTRQMLSKTLLIMSNKKERQTDARIISTLGKLPLHIELRFTNRCTSTHTLLTTQLLLLHDNSDN